MSRRPTAGDGRGPRRRHPTIVDVAERAGVSKSLVSLVLRDAPNVSDEKRAAVTKAAEEIGYRPNAVARSLVRRRSFLIGVMVSDLHNPYFTEVIDGIQAAARGSGYHALFNTGGRDAAGEDQALDTLLQLRPDGIVMAGPVLPPAGSPRSSPRPCPSSSSRDIPARRHTTPSRTTIAWVRVWP